MPDQTVEAFTEPVQVLVVEDELLIQQLVETALVEAGYDVTAVSSGDEALKLLGQDPLPFRALVTDINLQSPVSGWQVAKQARERDGDIRVVYMTAASASEWTANGVPQSVLLTKPFAPAQIVSAVSSLLNAADPSPS
jgi:DNA-binding response OmpR family regulator